MRITRNTTMEQLIEAIRLNIATVRKVNKDLFDQIAYADKSMKSGKEVPKKEVADLVKAIMKSLGDKFVEPALAEEKETPQAENSVKAKTKLKSKKSGAKTEDTDKAEQSTETTEETPKADNKSTKKNTKKGSVVSVLENKETGEFNVMSFAEEFTDKDGVKYVRADDIETMEDLAKEEDLDNIVFAIYYNKKQLKKYGYSPMKSIPVPKEFPNDLDLCSPMWVSDNNIITYVISLYTEFAYAIENHQFEAVDGVRYINDIEYQIYRVVK